MIQHQKKIPQNAIESIPEKMRRCISELMENSKLLQSSIIKRDVNNVWKILSFQQEKMTEFEQYGYIWEQISSDPAMSGNESVLKVKKLLSEEFKRLRKLNNSNATLVQSFLSAIRKAMKKTTQRNPSHNHVYGNTGKMRLKQSSLMVNSIA